MDGEIKIGVLDRGFVVVGRWKLHTDLAYHWRISPCRIIRVWGTSNGLTELCAGPIRGKTILDPVSHETIPFRFVGRIIDASEEGWRKHLQ